MGVSSFPISARTQSPSRSAQPPVVSLLALLVSLALVGAAEAGAGRTFRRKTYPLADGSRLIIRTSCHNNELQGTFRPCEPPKFSGKDSAAAEEVVLLHDNYLQGIANLERAAASKDTLDTGTALMLQNARKDLTALDHWIADETRWERNADRSDNGILNSATGVQLGYRKVGEFMKAATPGLAKAESKEHARQRRGDEAAAAARREEKAKELASGVALADIPMVGKTDIGHGADQTADARRFSGRAAFEPAAAASASFRIEKRDEQRDSLRALREGRPEGQPPRRGASSSGPYASGDVSALAVRASGAPLTAPGAVAGSEPADGAQARGVALEPGAAPGTEEAPKNPGLAQRFVDKAWEAIFAGDYTTAEEAAKRALEADPKNAAALEVLALAQVKQGKFAEALVNASAAIELDPGRANAWAFRAYAKDALGDRLGGLDDLEKAAELDPRYAEKFRIAKAGGRIYDPSLSDPLNLVRRSGFLTLLPYFLGLAAAGGALARWRRRRRKGAPAPLSAAASEAARA